MIPVRQSTAFECSIGPVLDADGVAVTGCVVGDFKIKKTTGDIAALNASATLTAVGTNTGMYDLVLTTSDTDTVGLCSIVIDDTTNACAPLYLQVMEEAIYDALYAASANAFTGAAGSTKVSGVVLVDTLTTYTGNTPQTGDCFARLTGTGAVTFASLTVTGQFLISDGMEVNAATTNRVGLKVTGNGTAQGILATGGSSGGNGVTFLGTGGGGGLVCQAGITGSAALTLTASDGAGILLVPGASSPGIYNSGGTYGLDLSGTTGGLRATTLTVSGVTTLTGAVTATNASNDLRGILLQATQTGVTIPTVTTLTNLPAITANWLTAAGIASDAGTEIANAVMDLTDGVEVGLTPRNAMKLIAAASAGKLSGAATTSVVIRNAVADSKDRITATVDANGNRSAVTLDLT